MEQHPAQSLTSALLNRLAAELGDFAKALRMAESEVEFELALSTLSQIIEELELQEWKWAL